MGRLLKAFSRSMLITEPWPRAASVLLPKPCTLKVLALVV